MQSLRRQLRRGNAVFIRNLITNGIDLVTKRGSEFKYWNWAVSKSSKIASDNYIENVTEPLYEEDIQSQYYKKQIFKRKISKNKNK